MSCAIFPVFGNMETVGSTRCADMKPGAHYRARERIRNRLVGKGVNHEKDKPRGVGVVTLQ